MSVRNVLGTGMFVLSGLGVSSQGLDNMQFVRGTVYDSLTMTVIPDVHVITSLGGAVSNRNGDFCLMLKDGAVITFSHVGYKPFALIYDKEVNGSVLNIGIVPRIIILEEIRFPVRALPMDSLFRPPDRAKLSMIRYVRHNSMLTNIAARLAVSDWSTKDILLHTLMSPRDFTIVSTDRRKGVLAFRAVANPKFVPFRESPRLETGLKIPGNGGTELRMTTFRLRSAAPRGLTPSLKFAAGTLSVR